LLSPETDYCEPSRPRLQWLLVLNFPNGGSTAFAELLLTAPGTIRLHPTVEGQWLLPALCADKLRWDPGHAFDPIEVRDVWIRTALEQCRLVGIRSDEALVIEKSPPNMCRYHHLLGALKGMRTTVVVFTRDPYATCASWHRRYGPRDIARTWGWPGRERKTSKRIFRRLLQFGLFAVVCSSGRVPTRGPGSDTKILQSDHRERSPGYQNYYLSCATSI
jgi:hypothetical protein